MGDSLVAHPPPFPMERAFCGRNKAPSHHAQLHAVAMRYVTFDDEFLRTLTHQIILRCARPAGLNQSCAVRRRLPVALRRPLLIKVLRRRILRTWLDGLFSPRCDP